MCASLFPAKCYIKYLPGILSALSQTAATGKKNAYSAMVVIVCYSASFLQSLIGFIGTLKCISRYA